MFGKLENHKLENLNSVKGGEIYSEPSTKYGVAGFDRTYTEWCHVQCDDGSSVRDFDRKWTTDNIKYSSPLQTELLQVSKSSTTSYN